MQTAYSSSGACTTAQNNAQLCHVHCYMAVWSPKGKNVINYLVFCKSSIRWKKTTGRKMQTKLETHQRVVVWLGLPATNQWNVVCALPSRPVPWAAGPLPGRGRLLTLNAGRWVSGTLPPDQTPSEHQRPARLQGSTRRASHCWHL